MMRKSIDYIFLATFVLKGQDEARAWVPYRRPCIRFRAQLHSDSPYSVSKSKHYKLIKVFVSSTEDEDVYVNDFQEEDHVDVILKGLNEAQRKAVTQPLNSITRVIAGPGAGKTRVLTSRIAYLLKKDKQSENRVLAVTFTKKASMEMQQRLEQLVIEIEENQKHKGPVDVGERNDIVEEIVLENGSTQYNMDAKSQLTRVTLGTFHSICSKILRWNGDHLKSLPSMSQYTNVNLDASFAIIDQSDQLRIIKKCLTDIGVDLSGDGTRKVDIRPITILNAVGQLKSDEALGIGCTSGKDDYSRNKGGIKMTSKVRKIAEEVYPEYRKALLTQNSLDFDDLILMTRELLRTSPDIQMKMSKRWTHILVDEFQDTSEVQLDLVKLLSTSSLLIVGDGDQSIYSWRGAHAESMSDFVDKFERDVDTLYLMENYRSTTNIVRAAQKVISSSSSQEISKKNIRMDMKPMRGKGPSPRVLACANAKAEASFVVKEINKMVAEGMLKPSSTVAIIYRTNAQSRALEEACVENNLKYLMRGSAGTFYSRAEIKDCLCFLKWLYNGRDITSMKRAMTTPNRGLGDVSQNEFLRYCSLIQETILESDSTKILAPLDILILLTQQDTDFVLPLSTDGIISKRTLNRLIPFGNKMNTIMKRACTESVDQLLNTIIETMELKNHLDSTSKTSEEFADRWSNVMELLSASERYANEGPAFSRNETVNSDIYDLAPLGSFLDDVSLLSETENDANSDGADEIKDDRIVANLMTIHASKGMEFDACFLVGNEEGTFPTQRAISEGDGSIELDEERRLCYVAMTRAKTHLIMTWRKEVTAFFDKGFKVNKTERSRFLDALVSKTQGTENRNAKKRNQTLSDNNSIPRSYKNGSYPGASSRSRPKIVDDPLALPTPKRISGNKIRITQSKTSTQDLHAVKTILRNRAANRDNGEVWNRTQAQNNAKRTKKTKSVDPFGAINRSPPPIDSTIFFSVGSTVKHPVHGKGTICHPPEEDSMLVRVKFISGLEMNFPVTGSSLTQIF